jgi:hypothetical protein
MFGNARLLPPTVMDWIVDEVPDDFAAGRVFVAPARAIGVTPPTANESLLALSQISGGTAITPDLQVATSLMSLEIPFLDGLASGQFRTFLNQHEGELTLFRRAFRRLVAAGNTTQANGSDAVEEIQFQIAELTRSHKYAELRNTVAKLGGVLATLSAGVAVAKPGTAVSMAALAGAGAASAALFGLWKQSVDTAEKMAQNPFFVLWKLGVDRPSRVRSERPAVPLDVPKARIAQAPLVETANHWLCPPTCGVWFAGVRKKD